MPPPALLLSNIVDSKGHVLGLSYVIKSQKEWHVSRVYTSAFCKRALTQRTRWWGRAEWARVAERTRVGLTQQARRGLNDSGVAEHSQNWKEILAYLRVLVKIVQWTEYPRNLWWFWRCRWVPGKWLNSKCKILEVMNKKAQAGCCQES